MELKNFFAQDDQGNMLSDAICYVYQRGTESMASGLFGPRGGNLPNPFQGDAAGLIQFAAANGLYDLRVVKGARDYRIAVQFNDVTDSVAAAEQAASRAEVALDAGMLTAGLYPTTAQGLLETEDQAYFSVLSEDRSEYINLYQKSAGEAVLKKVYPSVVTIIELLQRFATLLPDNNIFPGQAWDADGVYRMAVTGSKDNLLYGIGERVIKWMNYRIDIGVDGRMSFMDGNGRTVLSIDSKGRIYASNLTIGRLKVLDPDFSAGSAGTVKLPFGQFKQTGVMQVTSDGQSLGVGVTSVPPISTAQPYSNIMFKSGVLVRPNMAGYDASAFVPLVESQILESATNEGDLGETPISGTLNGVVRRLLMSGEDASKWVFLGIRTGQSGQTVESASPGGSGTYETQLKAIDDGYALAVAQGKSWSYWAHLWTQGEANIKTVNASDAVGSLEYANRVLRQDQLLADYIAKKGYQDFRHALIMYQTAAHRRYNFDNLKVANAQWGMSRQHAHVVMATPIYFMTAASDRLHLTNESSWLLGQYYSRALHKTCAVHGAKWRPLEPIEVTWLNDRIDLRFHVPYGQLVLDNELCATVPTGYFGFDIREAGVVATDLISSVTVTSVDTVRIALNRIPAPDSLISYARGRASDSLDFGKLTGPRGNLRDTHGLVDQVVAPTTGTTFALHNACVMFEHHRINGFS